MWAVKMIARNSKSYPYLAIAQHYGISYAKVLEMSNGIRKWICDCCDKSLRILMRKPLEEQLQGTDSLGIKNLFPGVSLIQ